MDQLSQIQKQSRKKSARKEVECVNCGLHGLCQVAGLEGYNLDLLDTVVHRRKQIANGGELIAAGESFQDIYSVKSGMLKAVTYFDDGREQIVDFFLPGELIGLDAIDEGSYMYTVIALEDSSVCEMNYQAVAALDNRFADFDEMLIKTLTTKVRQSQYQSLLIGAQSAEQKLAVFLVSIVSRLQVHGMPADSFRLSMRRMDIANYLGLALETVGRVFKRFEQQGLVETQGRAIQVHDLTTIKKIAGLSGSVSPTKFI
jgi:CRP/FNR family transcriptional regulator